MPRLPNKFHESNFKVWQPLCPKFPQPRSSCQDTSCVTFNVTVSMTSTLEADAGTAKMELSWLITPWRHLKPWDLRSFSGFGSGRQWLVQYIRRHSITITLLLTFELNNYELWNYAYLMLYLLRYYVLYGWVLLRLARGLTLFWPQPHKSRLNQDVVMCLKMLLNIGVCPTPAPMWFWGLSNFQNSSSFPAF